MRSIVGGIRKGGRTFRKGAGALRRLGPLEFSRRVGRRFVNAYWRFRGTMTIEVGRTSNRFFSEYPAEIRVLRFSVKHERVVLEDMVEELEQDDTFFDIGANIGVHTCVGASVGADVVAFEPYPPNGDRLTSNVELNDLQERVDVRETALADESGVARFDSGALNSPGWPWASLSTSDDTVEVEQATGDSLVESGSVPQPTVVKIDVEGAEPLVVAGLSEALRDDACRLVYCEVHRDGEIHPAANDFGQTVEGLTGQLETLGFDVEQLDHRTHETYLKGTK